MNLPNSLKWMTLKFQGGKLFHAESWRCIDKDWTFYHCLAWGCSCITSYDEWSTLWHSRKCHQNVKSFEFFFLDELSQTSKKKKSLIFQFMSDSSEFTFFGCLLRIALKVFSFGYFPKSYAQVYFLGGFMANDNTLLLVFMVIIHLI